MNKTTQIVIECPYNLYFKVHKRGSTIFLEVQPEPEPTPAIKQFCRAVEGAANE